MSTRGGYPSAKEEFAISAINECVTGSLDAETLRETSVVVKLYADSGNGPRFANQTAARPGFRTVCWRVKYDGDVKLILGAGDQLLEFSEAGFRAGTARMRKHDQQRFVERG